MATIPLTQRQIALRAGGPSPVNIQTETTDSRILQQGLNSFANGAARLQQQQAAVKNTQYMTDYVNAQTSLSQSLNEARQQSQNGIDYIPQAQAIIRQHQEAFFSAHTDLSDDEKNNYEYRWAQARGQFENQAITWGQNQAKQISVSNLTNAASAVGNAILQDPASARSLATAHLQAIEQSDLDPATKAEIISRSRNSWELAAAQYGINTNPRHVIDQLGTFKAVQAVEADQGAASPAGSSGTLATRNNNPLNIRYSAENNWLGKGGENGTGFENFDTADHGFRAGLKLMKNHINNGADTLSALIKTWAPVRDKNNPIQYAQFVSHQTGIPVDSKLNPDNPQQMQAIAKAMAKQEGYGAPVSDDQLGRAWDSIGNPEMLAPGVKWGQLTPQQTNSIINQAEAKIDQQNATRRLLMQQQMQNDQALIEAGHPVQEPLNREQWMSTAQHDATPEQLTLLDRQYRQYAMLNELQPVYSAINTQSAADGLASVQGLRPQGNEDDFAYRQQRYGQALQKYGQVMKARESDPGGWLSQNSPEVQAAMTAWQQDPSQGELLAQQVLVEKSRLGIKSKKILPDVVADNILQQIDTSKEQSVIAIQNVAQQFGQWAPQVMQQVQQKAGPALQVVMATDNPRAANALWENRNVKTADLRNSLNTAAAGSADSADSEWASQSGDFAGTMVRQREGVQTWNNFNDQGRRLTYLNVQKGMSPGEAARQAFNDMLGSQYQVKGSWRLPVSSRLDIDDVQDGVSLFTDNLKDTDIMPLVGDPRISPEDNLKQSLDRIKDNGEWVTNADETGLVLTLNGLVVNDAHGQPLSVSFSQMATTGAEHRGVWNSLKKDMNRPRIYTPGEAAKVSQQRNEETARQLSSLGDATAADMAAGMRNANDNLHR